MITVGYRRTTAAEAKQFTAAAFLHLFMLSVEIFGLSVENIIERRRHRRGIAVKKLPYR
jgi:hypothetical protein